MHVRRLKKQFRFKDSSIIVIDETSVWNDMVSSPTVEQAGVKDVPLKLTRHEKVRDCERGWKKLKPFIVFAGAKRESESLHEESSLNALWLQARMD